YAFPRHPAAAPLAIVMVMVATRGLLMFDARWLRLESAWPPPCRGRPRHCRRSSSRAPRLTVGTIMITDWRRALLVDVPVAPRKRSGFGTSALPHKAGIMLHCRRRRKCATEQT